MMNFTIASESLAIAAKHAASCASKATVPIYKNTLILAAQNEIDIIGGSATLMTRQIRPAEVAEIGECLVDAKALAQLAANLPRGDVHISRSDSHLTLRAGRSRYRIAAQHAKDYPMLEAFGHTQQCTIEHWQLASLIAFCAPATSRDDVRHYLRGIHLRVNSEGLIASASDGHRLHQYRNDDVKSAEEWDAILPNQSIAELRNLIDPTSQDEITIDIAPGASEYSTPTWGLRITHLDGRYPNVQKLIDGDPTRHITTRRADINEPIKRLKNTILAADSNFKAVVLRHENQTLKLFSQNAHAEQGEEIIDAEETADTETSEFGLNALMLADAINAFDGEKIIINYTDHEQKVKIHDGDPARRVIVLMPLHL